MYNIRVLHYEITALKKPKIKFSVNVEQGRFASPGTGIIRRFSGRLTVSLANENI